MRFLPCVIALLSALPAFADEEAKALVERARLEPHLVCDPYPAEVRVGDDGSLRPASVRERVRAFGPTIPLPTSR